MKNKLATLLDLYAESHQNPKNQRIHRVAVPLILFSLLGILFQFKFGPTNAAEILLLFGSLYYLQFKSIKVFTIIYLQVIPMLFLIRVISVPAIPFYLGIFILAWIAQFIGHKIEGKKPSFFQDLQFLMVGPLWLFKNFLQ